MVQRDAPAPVAATIAVYMLVGRALRWVWAADGARLPLLTLYYLAIIVALIVLYGVSHYTPPPFVYQGF